MKQLTLYEHQDRLVTQTRDAMKRKRSILMQSATGSGKTAMSVYMISRAYQKGKRVWFTVPRRELIRQTAATMDSLNVPYGYIAAGYAYNPYAKVHICSVGTLKARLMKLQAPDLAVIDETHYGEEALDQIIKWLKAAGTFIIGLSATPWKSSGEGLGKWYDVMVEGPSIRWLIDNGFLSQFRAFAPSHPDLSKIKTVGGDYARGQLSSFMEQDRVLIGDAVRHYRDHAMGRLNIVYCTSRKHSEMTAAQFRDAGVPAMHMDGETPEEDRRKIIRAFARRELLALCNVDLCTFGFDLSAQAGFEVTVECMSDLRPTKSLSLQLQKWGRVLRKKDYPAIILDHSNNIGDPTFGLPDTDREWTLADRLKTGRGEGGENTIASKSCPKCFFTHKPAPECPDCGHVYEIQYREVDQVDGDLIEISGADAQRTAARMKQGMAKTIEDLTKEGMERGMEPWKAQIWASKIFTARLAKQREREGGLL